MCTKFRAVKGNEAKFIEKYRKYYNEFQKIVWWSWWCPKDSHKKVKVSLGKRKEIEKIKRRFWIISIPKQSY